MTNPKITQIITLISDWNDSSHPAVHRDNLRRLLGWKQGMSLGQLVDREYNRNPAGRVETDPLRLVKQVRSNEVKVDVAASHILNSGWDFTDPRTAYPLTMNPAQVKDFLEGVELESRMFDELVSETSPNPYGRRNLFGKIMEAYTHWVRSSR